MHAVPHPLSIRPATRRTLVTGPSRLRPARCPFVAANAKVEELYGWNLAQDKSKAEGELTDAKSPEVCGADVRPTPCCALHAAPCDVCTLPQIKTIRASPVSSGVRELRVNDIRRPLARTRTNDSAKVEALMESIQQHGLKEPIDVLEVEGKIYGFSGGCSVHCR